MAEETKDKYIKYFLKEKHVLLDTETNEPYLEEESREELMLSLLVDIKNRLTKLERGLM